MRTAAALILAALLLPALAADAAAPAVDERCKSQRVPCGYIYPRILLEGDIPATPPPLGDAPIVIEATLAYEFDPMAEGLALDDPRNPIFVTFEFPRKPSWAAMSVEPAEIPIPIQPQYFQPDPADPQNPQAPYRYSAPITITIAAASRPVLPDGTDTARLYVFAKSTESGLYKPGYGIREAKVAPVDPLHEADLGPRVVLDPVDPEPVALADLTVDLAPGLAATLDFAPAMEYWRPTPVTVSLAPAAAAEVLVALLDETDHVHALAGPHAAPFSFNVTFPRAGEWRFVVLARGDGIGPAAGAARLDLAEPPAGTGWRMPRDYRVLVTSSLSRASASTGDPAAQDETIVPFPVFEGASAAEVGLALSTPGAPLDRGAANVNVAILDPTGAVLQQGTVDPANPAKRFPVGALPGPGLYTARVFGAGSAAAAWTLGLQILYDKKPVIADATPWANDVRRMGQHNATVEVAPADAWTPTAVSLVLTRPDGAAATGLGRITLAALDADDAGAVTRGTLQTAAAEMGGELVFPRPGRYTVLAVADSVPGSATQWGTGLVATTISVGDPEAAVFSYPTSLDLPLAAAVQPGGWQGLGQWRLPLLAGAGDLQLSLDTNGVTDVDLLLFDAAGSEVARSEARNALPGAVEATLSAPSPGTYTLLARARAVTGADVAGTLAVAYSAAPSEANPLARAPPVDAPVPGAAGLVALAALALAAARRRG